MDTDQSVSIDRFKRLAAINRSITNSLDFDEVLHLIIENAAELIEAEASVLLLVDRDGQLRVRAHTGALAESFKASAFQFSGPMEESVVEQVRKLLSPAHDVGLVASPIVDSHAVSGVLAVTRRTELSADEQWLLSALADQAAITLRNARLHEMEVEQWRWQSARLAEVGRELSSELDLDKVLAAVCRAARDLTGSDGATFVLLEGERVHYACADAVGPLWQGQRFPIEQCISGWSVTERATAIVEDVFSYERIPERTKDEAYRPTFVRSLVMAPVRAHDPLGAIGAYWAKPHRASQREVQMIQALADAASISVENALLYGQMRAARLEAEQRAEALMRLEEASVTLLTKGEYQSYDQLIELICCVTGAPRGIFWEVGGPARSQEKGTAFLFSNHTYGLEPDLRHMKYLQHLPLDSPDPSARAARLQDVVWVPDLSADGVASHIDGVDQGLFRSTLAIPLRVRERLLGVISLYWNEPDVCNQNGVKHIAEVVVNQVAASLDIAQLITELTHTSRLKDEFLATLSHELRNPLNAIVGYAVALTRAPEAVQSPQVREASEAIYRNALAQSQLISDLLDLSRRQTGKLALEKRLISLPPVIADAIESVRAEAAAKQINLIVELSPEPLTTEADSVRVQQIAWNLLSNAVKFTPQGGSVTVRVSRDGDQARLSVEDTGQGIEPGFLPHVFDLFRQADGSTIRRYRGLGIGLALVRQLTELHGGRVRAESDGPGRGARFTVWLPLQVAATAASGSTSARPPARSLANLRLLVIDDSRDNIEMMRQLLESEGAEVTTAESGAEALRIAEDKDFDLILSDISMPDMNGYQLLRELRTRERTANVPAIALTGFGQAEDEERARAAGFSAQLTKPIDFNELIQVAVNTATIRNAASQDGHRVPDHPHPSEK